jgi:hypothetical protein
MALPEKRDHRIPLNDAVELARQHRKDHPKEPKAHFFHREAFDALLKQPGAAGIRIYRGKGKGGEHHLVMVAVDGTGEDMTTGATIMEQDLPCPPFCPPASPLSA